MRKVIPFFLASVAAAHHHKALNRAALYSFDDFVRRAQHCMMGEANRDGAAFQFQRALAAFRARDKGREILLLAGFAVRDVRYASEASKPRGENTVAVRFAHRGNAVGGHQDSAVKTFKFFGLLPPGAAVIASQMRVFL